MGHFQLQHIPETHLLVQAAVPGLEERLRAFPPLRGLSTSAGAERYRERAF